MATVHLRGQLRQLAGETDPVVDGTTVHDVLSALERSHPPLRGWILDERGRIRPHLNVFLDGAATDPHAAVGPASRLHVLPSITGGAR